LGRLSYPGQNVEQGVVPRAARSAGAGFPRRSGDSTDSTDATDACDATNTTATTDADTAEAALACSSTDADAAADAAEATLACSSTDADAAANTAEAALACGSTDADAAANTAEAARASNAADAANADSSGAAEAAFARAANAADADAAGVFAAACAACATAAADVRAAGFTERRFSLQLTTPSAVPSGYGQQAHTEDNAPRHHGSPSRASRRGRRAILKRTTHLSAERARSLTDGVTLVFAARDWSPDPCATSGSERVLRVTSDTFPNESANMGA
jgi:hypothetical protein